MTQVENLLPVGSVVLNKGANKKLMIIGILVEIDGVRHDYIAVTYPEGFMDPQHMYAFNHEDIEEVVFLGYMNAEFQLFRGTLAEAMRNNT